ncbi:hypothetical protein H4R18_004426 [Coemansia javaensis]|uniref:Peptidase S1 domain-containing protein n=1 Tax=Coemansia javaensis TaxID=2761396 RepID=A0A9W8LGX8_9FUNG|nr:hypothetical protein H4R18_004426 [Coemansia javaensis]
MKSVGFLGLVALAAAYSVSQDDAAAAAAPRIAGGHQAAATELRSTAYLRITRPMLGNLWCTANLIAPNVLLTVGGCAAKNATASYPASDVLVSFDRTALNGAKDIANGLPVSKILIHPEDSSKNSPVSGIALITLSKPVPESTATPIKIGRGRPRAGTEARAAGFGATAGAGSYDETSFTQLTVADMKIGADAACAKEMAGYDPKTQLCAAGAAGAAACAGDTAGPLVVSGPDGKTDVLVGMSTYSFAKDLKVCGAAGSMSYYVHVAPYLDWIAKNAALDVADIAPGGTTDGSSETSAAAGMAVRLGAAGATAAAIASLLLF